jgi:hypothetical protein
LRRRGDDFLVQQIIAHQAKLRYFSEKEPEHSNPDGQLS